MDRVQNEKSETVSKRIDHLDMKGEESRQTIQEQANEHKRLIESLQYNLQTKTRDLTDSINTINNRFSILENTLEQFATAKGQNNVNGAMAKVVHKFADLLVSILVAATSLFQVVIQFLNAGASIAENKCVLIKLLDKLKS
ncbi:hypothetical protein Ciccas_008926 [Cichlidogyrus casuarinus]|uniref:Uncharacterized protein n=1 Tax=Cichlidogyrus casuarinus TaxID=1844966 RepID=A0ABD2PYI2_9PLAT